MEAAARRQAILNRLRTADRPVSASSLAAELNVSRQIIVGDIALLRAGGAEISSTPRGYVLPRATDGITRTIACRHTLEQTGTELDILVDNGCTVLDVIVEHPVYGQLTGQLQISSRYDVEQFLARVQAHDAAPRESISMPIAPEPANASSTHAPSMPSASADPAIEAQASRTLSVVGRVTSRSRGSSMRRPRHVPPTILIRRPPP